MDSTRIQIGLLEGKENWLTWRYKVSIVLRGVPSGLDVVNGILSAPEKPRQEASSDDKQKYLSELATFEKADSNALVVLTTNMTEEVLKMAMKYTSAREVWLELHRLFDGLSEDKAFELSMNFFSFKRNMGDDIAAHTSKLKNIWSDLKVELSKDGSSDLPEVEEILNRYYSHNRAKLNLTTHSCYTNVKSA